MIDVRVKVGIEIVVRRHFVALTPFSCKRADIRPNLRTKGYARRVTIAFSVDVPTATVAIHGVFYGGQDFEQLLRDTGDDD